MTTPAPTTPARLVRLRAVMMVLTTAVFAGSFTTVIGVRSTMQNMATNTAPAVLEVLAARAAVLRADAAAMASFQTGQVQLVGPGEDYQTQLALANQSLTQAAEHNTAGDPAIQQLQLVEGLLSAYSGLIERADAYFEQNARNPLGITYLWDGSILLNAPETGIVAELGSLAALEQDALTHQLSSGWLSALTPLLWIAPIAALFALLLVTQQYLRRRFHRTVNPALLAATMLLLLITTAMSTVVTSKLQAGAANDTLGQVSGQWQQQADGVSATAGHALGEMLRTRCGTEQGGCGTTGNAYLAGLPQATNPARNTDPRLTEISANANDEFVSAEANGALGYLVPLGTAALAALILSGLQRRLREYS